MYVILKLLLNKDLLPGYHRRTLILSGVFCSQFVDSVLQRRSFHSGQLIVPFNGIWQQLIEETY